MIESLLVANRGEIACRVFATAKRMGIRTVAVFSDADADALHVAQADSAVHIGPSPAAQSYLDVQKIIAAAKASGVQAIHPGYGFLSENAEFVDAVEAAGLIFIGPSASSIRAMGLKDAAKALMEEEGVPVVPGYHGADQSPELLASEASRIGYPVMIKARAGGGGKGMRLVESADEFEQALESAAREGLNAFGDASVLVEKYINSPRHIEVQVFGDSGGNVIHLFERDCSLQRRHQKVIEEAPAPDMSEAVRSAMTEAACKAAKAINYQGAGTIEFIADGSSGLRADGFWFMEMNTRLQVEHPVTEAITGVDLVELQIRVASGEDLPIKQSELAINGHAFEARLYAEDVVTGFLPATGRLHELRFVSGARVDTGVKAGSEITPFYDPMIAKVITHGATRNEALGRLSATLAMTHVAGTVTNLAFLNALSRLPDFKEGKVDTGLIGRNIESLTRLEPPSHSSLLIAAISLLSIDLTRTRGWRLWGDASHLVTLRFNDAKKTVRVTLHRDKPATSSEATTVSMSDVEDEQLLLKCSVTPLGEFDWSVRQEGVQQLLEVFKWQTKSNHCVSVRDAGVITEFLLSDPLEASTQQSSNTDQVVAPMTGIVTHVDVKQGQSVMLGDRLLVLEAMKMETSVNAPREGVIKDISCEIGEAVEGGSVLIGLE